MGHCIGIKPMGIYITYTAISVNIRNVFDDPFLFCEILYFDHMVILSVRAVIF